MKRSDSKERTFMFGMLFQRITPQILVGFSLKAIVWKYRAWVNFGYTFIVHSKCSIGIHCPFMEYVLQNFPFCVPQKIKRCVGLEKFVIYDHKIRRRETNVSSWTVESNGRVNTWHVVIVTAHINHTLMLHSHFEAVRLISISWKLHFHVALLSVWRHNLPSLCCARTAFILMAMFTVSMTFYFYTSKQK